ncbi:17645_t:CDS:2, partial [Acaulospora colombiana]
MPSTRSTVQIWGFMNWTKVHSEEVLSSDTLATASTEVNPWVHWIGEKPTRGEPSIDGKVLLYVHGGGFVLPLSSGHLAMVTTLLREAKSKSSKPIYLAVAEY